jgi:hypothetical protein
VTRKDRAGTKCPRPGGTGSPVVPPVPARVTRPPRAPVTAASRRYLRARSADGKASAAEQVMNTARQESADALKEAAAALGRISQVTEQQLPPREVRWAIEHVTGQRFQARNDGSITAEDALLEGAGTVPQLISPDETKRRDVRRGGALTFQKVSRLSSLEPTIRLTWTDENGPHGEEMKVYY